MLKKKKKIKLALEDVSEGISRQREVFLVQESGIVR